MSTPNQKIIKIEQREVFSKENLYCMVHIDAMQEAMNVLSGENIKLWLYLNKNQDNYQFELSQKALEPWGLKKDSYYRAVNKLIELHYLNPVVEGSNIYYFSEKPKKELSQNAKNSSQIAKKTNSVTTKKDNEISQNTKDFSQKPKDFSQNAKNSSQIAKKTNSVTTKKDNEISQNTKDFSQKPKDFSQNAKNSSQIAQRNNTIIHNNTNIDEKNSAKQNFSQENVSATQKPSLQKEKEKMEVVEMKPKETNKIIPKEKLPVIPANLVEIRFKGLKYYIEDDVLFFDEAETDYKDYRFRVI